MTEFTLHPKISKTLGHAVQFWSDDNSGVAALLGKRSKFSLTHDPCRGWFVSEDDNRFEVFNGDWVVYFPDDDSVTVYEDLEYLRRDYRLELR